MKTIETVKDDSKSLHELIKEDVDCQLSFLFHPLIITSTLRSFRELLEYSGAFWDG